MSDGIVDVASGAKILLYMQGRGLHESTVMLNTFVEACKFGCESDAGSTRVPSTRTVWVPTFARSVVTALTVEVVLSALTLAKEGCVVRSL